jgi:TonB-dependent receptor
MADTQLRKAVALACATGLATACLLYSTFASAQQDTEQIDEVVVYGVSTGAKRAIELQKSSSTLVTIVSEETLDSLPDQSIGEVMSRLPGVGVWKDRGEAERIFIRGADARLNAVTMNGDRLPSPESTVDPGGGQRHARMTTIPSTLISGIEVYKAVPPNMDADSIGGAVEFKTKSATDLTDTLLDATVRFGQNDLNDGNLSSAEFTFGDRLNDAGTFGMIVTASWEDIDRAVEGITASWDDTDTLLDLATGLDVDLGQDHYVIEDWDLYWRDVERERKGFNVTFDYKPSGNTIVKWGGFWSSFEDYELRRRLQLRPGASADFTSDTEFDSNLVATSGSTDGGRVRRRVRPGTKTSDTWNAFVEGSTTFAENEWTLDWRASHTFADHLLTRTRTRWEVRGQDEGFRGDGIADWTFSGGNTDRLQLTQPAWGNDPDLLHFGNRGDYRHRRDLSEDEITAFKFDLSKPFDIGDATVELQFGYKGRFNDRSQLNGLFQYDGSESPTIYMSDALGRNQTTPVQPFGYENGIWGDQDMMDALFLSQPESFVFDGDNTDEDYFVEEDIHAAYVMGTITKGDWTTIVGARFEDTETVIDARDASAKHSYDHFLPAIIARYQPTENIVWRAAWTNGIGRPDFTDIRPFFDDDFEWDDVLGEAELSIDGGNPELDPFEAQSFDFSFEYYMDNGGVFSAGIFYKTIDNFEYREELRESDVPISSLPVYMQDLANQAIDDARQTDPTIPADLDTLTRFRYERPVSGDEATLTGYEFNYQQKFDDLPAPWNNFGVFANYTRVDGDSDITSDISRKYLIGQYDSTTNLQLFYETENFSARLAWNRNGVNYEDLGLGISGGVVTDDPVEDVAIDAEETMDLALQYHLSDFTLFFDITNLTDEVSAGEFLGSTGTFKRFNEVEAVGRTFVLGVNWSL